jgi:hypothetical protein
MKLTKLLAMLLALCMIICCFAACGGSDDDDDDDKDEKVEDKEKDEDEDEDDKSDKDDEDEDDDKPSKKPAKDDEDEDDDKPSKKPSKDEDDEKDEVVLRPSDDSIEGKWVVRFPFMDVIEKTGSAGALGSFESGAEVYMSFEFDDAEKVILSVDMSDCVEDFCDDFIEYLEDGGIEEYVELNTEYTFEEFEDEFDKQGMTWDDFYDQIRDSMETSLQGADLSSVNSGKYSFDGDVIEIEGVEFEVELDGDEMEIVDINGDAGPIGDLLDGRTLKKVA